MGSGRGSCPGPTILSHLTHRGLFKTDRVLGTAQLKLEALETACEVREILEVRGGRSSECSRMAVSLVNIIQMPLLTQPLPWESQTSPLPALNTPSTLLYHDHAMPQSHPWTFGTHAGSPGAQPWASSHCLLFNSLPSRPTRYWMVAGRLGGGWR